MKTSQNIVMFVGLQGSGKTTTCTKYAYFYKKKNFHVALICADTFRAGAFDQLKQNATKLGLPFYGSYVEADPVKVALDGLAKLKSENFDLIVIDTSGRHRQELALFEEMKQLEAAVKPNHIVFVIDSHIGQACYDQAKAFRDVVSIGSIIITKLDGHSKGGGALSAAAATNAPIGFLGTGEHFDEFEEFDAHSFISRLLGMGDLKLLMSTVSEVIPTGKQTELVQKLSHGSFTLKDMKEQFQNILKMGSLSHFLSMVPGFKSNGMFKKGEQEGIIQIKRFLIILDSMTESELNCLKPISNTCICRIAKGSGHHVKDVQALLDRHKIFSKMFGQFGKNVNKKGIDMSKNASQMLQNFQKGINPSMIKQLTGNPDIMNMMRQFQ